MESTKIRLCEPSTLVHMDEQWRRLYEAAFPAGERESEEKLRRLMSQGRLLLHRTLTEQGDLLGFTMVSLASNFSFLAYMATDPQRRSSGLGSKHLARLVELLEEAYPTHIGLFLEIEATDPDTITITEEERHTRVRRLKFYQKAGARVVCDQAVYLTPSYTLQGKYWEGDLLCIDFDEPVCKHQVARVIREIYARIYELPKDHELIGKVLTEFQQCSGGKCHDSRCGSHGLLHGISCWLKRAWERLIRVFS